MEIEEKVQKVKAITQSWRAQGHKVAFVPTMGALHEGHLALVKKAREVADKTVVSIFVNPTQFAPHEDFASYPRTLEKDLEKLKAHSVDLVFVPTENEIYPYGNATWVDVEDYPAKGLEAFFRPHHFKGVATVVTKLFMIVKPDIAIFGEKDAQQLAVVNRIVKDLFLDIEIIPHPVVRENNGLALSSRNSYLSEQEKQKACALYEILKTTAKTLEAEKNFEKARAQAWLKAAEYSYLAIEYIEIVDPITFKPLHGNIYDSTYSCFAVIAAKIGSTRLIDALRIGG